MSHRGSIMSQSTIILDLERAIAERDEALARAEKAEAADRNAAEAIRNIGRMQERAATERDDARAAAAGLAEALQKLRNEVHGLRAFEFGVRDAISNTNWHVLQLRADEADAALDAYAATGAGK